MHAIAGALASDDLDAAIEHGLLDAGDCPGCAPACRQRVAAARDARLAALAARERHRLRGLRLQQRARERERRSEPDRAALPPAAAAALARALARARPR